MQILKSNTKGQWVIRKKSQNKFFCGYGRKLTEDIHEACKYSNRKMAKIEMGVISLLGTKFVATQIRVKIQYKGEKE